MGVRSELAKYHTLSGRDRDSPVPSITGVPQGRSLQTHILTLRAS